MYVAHTHPFARPNGAENVVRVVGADSGALEFFGLGAGGAASASSVVGDIMAAVRARENGVTPRRGVVGEPVAVTALSPSETVRGIPLLV